MGKPKNEYTFILIDTSDTMNQETIAISKEEEDDKKKKKDKDKKKGKDSDILSRFHAAIEASKTIVLTKKRVVETDKFGIIEYNSKQSCLVQELTNNHDQLLQALDRLSFNRAAGTPSNKGGLAGALGLVIQEFAKQLKFVGNLMLRIFILTDDMIREGITPEEKKYTEINRDIGVYVDILYFGPDPDNKGTDDDADADGYFAEEKAEDAGALQFDLKQGEEAMSLEDRQLLESEGLLIPGLKSVAKKPGTAQTTVKKRKQHKDIRLIAELTDGTFFNGEQNTATIAKHARKLGDIKDLEEGLEVFESPPVRKKKLMAAIAEQLLPLDISEIQAISQGKAKTELKCNICFKKDNPITLRRCSYCKREMHLACVMKWAEQDQDKEEAFIFRCPFCFHLLKVDPQLTKLMDLQTMRANVAKMQESKATKPREADATCLQPEAILAIVDPCEVCGMLLEEDDCVFQCSNCKAAYHNRCFGATQEKGDHFCRKCGFRFTHIDAPTR
nr:hypothetical protein [Candidatus Sigynarchaeota archaeon]